MFNVKNSNKELITADEIQKMCGNMSIHTLIRANEVFNKLSGDEFLKIAMLYEYGRIQGKREERANKRITPPENRRKIDVLTLEYISKLIEIVLCYEKIEHSTGIKEFKKNEYQEKLYNVLNAI